MNVISNSFAPGGVRSWLACRRIWVSLFLATVLLLTLFFAMGEVSVRTQGEPGDLGDAPDSTNHHGLDNTAYAFAVPIAGRFPTVWAGPEPSGPRHADITQVWLGEGVSWEHEADIDPDQDTINNILKRGDDVRDVANNDMLDDGWLNPDVFLGDCQESALKVRVSKGITAQLDGPLFLNVWFDGNRDGDWGDIKHCNEQQVAFEWIVQNFVIDSGAIPPGGFLDIWVPTFLVMNDEPTLPSWMRFTLSEIKAPHIPESDLADGRGPYVEAQPTHPNQYMFGETEDYRVNGIPVGDPGPIGIGKEASVSAVMVGEVYTYSVFLESSPNGVVPAMTVMTDVLHPALRFVGGPWVTEVHPSANPPHAYFMSGVGASGAIGWRGSLSPGAAIRIDYQVKLKHCHDDLASIVNKAVAVQIDGNLIDAAAEVAVECPQPSTDITLRKHIVAHTGELVDEWHVLPGHEVAYQLVLSSTKELTRPTHIRDEMPEGLIALEVGANDGVPQIIDDGHVVVWDGELGPANRPIVIRILAKLSREAKCGDVFVNKALWYTPFEEGWSNQVWTVLRCHDLGDAPDSSNHSGSTMEAYPAVPAHFPTVYGVAPPYGPRHELPRPLHLGRMVSPEFEADVGPDADGLNNIDPLNNAANLDKADDGLEMDKMNFSHCQYHRFPVWVYVDPIVGALLEENDRIAYLNVWLDGNHDGDWADLHQCAQSVVPEHIVVDKAISVGVPGLQRVWVTTSSPVFWPPDAGAAWLRVTLSASKSVKMTGSSYGDGRGPAGGFALGETEDYVLRPVNDLRPDVAVEKDVFLHPLWAHTPSGEWKEVWAVGWPIHYANVGAAPAHNVQVVDTYDTGEYVPLGTPATHAWPPLPVSQSGSEFTFGVGTLLPGEGGHIFIRALFPLTLPPGAVLTNTVTISSTGEVNPDNNKSTVTATIPFLPPRIFSPRPGTSCTGDLTVTGRVQALPPVATSPISVALYVDGSLYGTVEASREGHWEVPVSLSDGDHELWAVAHYVGRTSPESHHVKITVDSGLGWSPISLRFEDESGFVIWPGDQHGRMDETGWRVFLRPGLTYTATVYLCCVDPGAQVTLEVSGLTVSLSDPDGDQWYEGTFTAPDRLRGVIRLCVICEQIKRCSDGEILIDPEGTVYDLDTGQEIEGAEVTCYEAQSGEGDETYYGLWPADEYEQVNPQTTGIDGYYSFFTPAGTYRVGAAMDGYQPHFSGDLVVVDEPVEYDIYMAPEITGTADYTITISSLGFDPPILEVSPGSIIAWINVDGALHASSSVTPSLRSAQVIGQASNDAWDSGLLDVGEVYKHQLNSGGLYTYQDGDNGVYTGQIIVQSTVYLPIVLKQYAP